MLILEIFRTSGKPLDLIRHERYRAATYGSRIGWSLVVFALGSYIYEGVFVSHSDIEWSDIDADDIENVLKWDDEARDFFARSIIALTGFIIALIAHLAKRYYR